jgi:hypothetical protein
MAKKANYSDPEVKTQLDQLTHEGLEAARSIVDMFETYVKVGQIEFGSTAIRFGENEVSLTPEEYITYAKTAVITAKARMREQFIKEHDFLGEDDKGLRAN